MDPLYREHFGLTTGPFNVTPDPSFLYLSATHEEALAQLVYGINARKGFVVLTGEVGTGKTTPVHALLRKLNGKTRTALVFKQSLRQKIFCALYVKILVSSTLSWMKRITAGTQAIILAC